MPALSCARHWRRDPRALLTSVRHCFQGLPGHCVRTPFLTHHVVLNLGFTLTILHVVLDLVVGTFSARLVLTPCSFTLLVVLGASCLRTLVQ